VIGIRLYDAPFEVTRSLWYKKPYQYPAPRAGLIRAACRPRQVCYNFGKEKRVKKEEKKELDIDEAAKQLAVIVETHLKSVSPAERKRRIKKGHSRVLRTMARKAVRGVDI
jgi:hypothetical protein